MNGFVKTEFWSMVFRDMIRTFINYLNVERRIEKDQNRGSTLFGHEAKGFEEQREEKNENYGKE